jgi:GGDEF domain-containing protein
VSGNIGTAAVVRARSALARFIADEDAVSDPMLPAALLALGAEPSSALPSQLLALYERREPGYGRENARRYRWGLGFHDEPGNLTYAGASPTTRMWRPREWEAHRDHPGRYAQRVLVPVALATQLEFWQRIAERGDGPTAERAVRLLADTQPTAENDVAVCITALDPWADTFALWLLTDHPGAHERLRDLVFALAVRYGQIAQRSGVVLGNRYPFWQEPLVSASAHLGLALWRLGIHPTLLPTLIAFVRSQQRPDGGWADADQPSDVLTTLAAAELLSALDPSFDPTPVTTFFVRAQEPAGWWRALNPEVPWLTGAIATWLERSPRSFADRFAWPELPVWSRDRTTRLPTMAVFDELVVALGAIDGLAQAPLEVAFIDLAGFGAFNNSYGMDAGDRALAAYAAALRALPQTLTIRQGGDELLVLGTPGRAGGLEGQLRAFMVAWPEQAKRAGVPRGGVVPRILLASGRAGELRRLRTELGTAIGVLEKATEAPGPDGLLVWLDQEVAL